MKKFCLTKKLTSRKIDELIIGEMVCRCGKNDEVASFFERLKFFKMMEIWGMW